MNFYAEVVLRIKDDLDSCVNRLVDTHFKDKTVPLDERWETFEKVCHVLPVESCGDGFIEKLGMDSVYDQFYVERHQTRMYNDLMDVINEFLQEETISKEQYDAWREAVLESGFGGFIHDW